MQNLAKAIEQLKNSLVLAKTIARESQCIYTNPAPSIYFDELNKLTDFYSSLNRYFLTHDISCLNYCYALYFNFENEGWVIERGRFTNLLFQRCISKLELIVEAWFYRYAVNLNFEWLNNSLEVVLMSELNEFKRLRLRSNVRPTSFESFKKQVDFMPEMRLFYLIQRKKEEYLEFTTYKLSRGDWDYRKPLIYDGMMLYNTEINVPSIEVDLAETVYFKARQMGIQWASQYITEPTARNSFIRANGLQG